MRNTLVNAAAIAGTVAFAAMTASPVAAQDQAKRGVPAIRGPGEKATDPYLTVAMPK